MSKKIKFNGIDLFIVIVIVVVIAAGIYVLGGRENSVASTENGELQLAFSVELTAQDKEYTELIKVGDKVLVGEKDKEEAVVTKVEVLPAKTTGYDILNGNVMRSELPNKYDINVYMIGAGVETDSALKLGGTTELRVGQPAVLSSKLWTGYGYVIALDVVK